MICPKCKSSSHIWVNQITEKLTCHRYGCDNVEILNRKLGNSNMHNKDFAKEVHNNAVEKGFWADENLHRHVALINSEVSEFVEAYRDGITANVDMYNKDIEITKDVHFDCSDLLIESFEKYIKKSYQCEIADIYLRLLDLCEGMNVYVSNDRIEENCDRVYNIAEINENMFMAVNRLQYHISTLQDKHTGDVNRNTPSLSHRLESCFRGVNAISDLLNVDLRFYVAEKHKYNLIRPYLHGKNF